MLKKYYKTFKNSKTLWTLTVVVLLYVVLLNQIIVINLVKLHSKMFALQLWLMYAPCHKDKNVTWSWDNT